jgi:hypothetical protein
MRKGYVASIVLLVAVLTSSTLMRAQTAAPKESNQEATSSVDKTFPIHADGWGRPVLEAPKSQNPAPAPKHDLSGIWEPANGCRDGVQAFGAKANPSDGKHVLPMTPLGEQMFKANKPSQGITSVGARDTNDPANISCDRLGMPREELYNFRGLQIARTESQVLMLYQYDQAWRTIWTDGRELPQDLDTLEPRWYGYSVGKWLDDTTLVVETVGMDERTWIDNGGRPHSSELRVEERFHRVNHDIMEVTMTIDDPKIYTKPWLALDKFPLRLQPNDFDIREMICSPSELADYLKQVAATEGGPGDSPKP